MQAAEPGSHAARARTATRVTLTARAAQTAIGVGALAVLARLVPPEDFGLVAMATVFTGIAANLNDYGLPVAISQRDEFTPTTRAALTRWHRRHNARIIGALLLISPILAWFYGRVEVLYVTPALAVGTFAQGLSAIPTGVLRRGLRFPALMGAQVAANALSSAAAIALAWRGADLWALIAQLVGLQILTAVALHALTRSRPLADAGGAEHAGGEASPDLQRFGTHLTAAKFLRLAARRVDQLLIGRLAGAEALGLYQQAYKWAWFPQKQITAPLLGVNVADLSRLRPMSPADDPLPYRRQARVTQQTVYACLLPVLTGLHLEAERVIRLLLGDQWDAAVPLFRLLLVFVVVYTPLQLLKQVYYTEGRSAEYLRWSVWEAGGLAVAAAAGALAGPESVALALAVAAAALTVIAIPRACRGSVLTPADLLMPIAAPAVAAAVAAAAAMRHREPARWAALEVAPAFETAIAFLSVYAVAFALATARRRAL